MQSPGTIDDGDQQQVIDRQFCEFQKGGQCAADVKPAQMRKDNRNPQPQNAAGDW